MLRHVIIFISAIIIPLTARGEWDVVASNISDPLTVSVDFNIHNGGIGDFEIWIDATPPYKDGGPYMKTGYRISVHTKKSDNRGDFIILYDDGDTTDLDVRGEAINSDEWHNLRVERYLDGGIEVYMDDTLFMSANDSSYTSGEVVIRTWSSVSYRNVEITEGSSPQVNIHSVEQQPGTKTVEVVYSAVDPDNENSDLSVTLEVKDGIDEIYRDNGLAGGENQVFLWNARENWNRRNGELNFTIIANDGS